MIELWEEAVSESLIEHSVSLTSDDVEAIAKDMLAAHESMNEHSAPTPGGYREEPKPQQLWRECGNCGGTGYLDCYTPRPPRPTCPSCEGSGKISVMGIIAG